MQGWSDADLTADDPSVILQILFEQLGYGQVIGAVFQAFAAIQAAFDLLHFRLPFLRQPACGGRAADELRHAGAVVDLNACRAGRTVAAAAAEIAQKLFAVALNERSDFPGHLRGIFHVGKEFA